MEKTLRDSALVRWIVLVLISGIFFATYWFYDFFSPIKELMIQQLGLSNADYGLIISATTWANVFGMIIVGGIFLDRFGIRLAFLVFGTLCALGAALVAVGSTHLLTTDPKQQMILMMIGRLLFGAGLEITCVVVTRTVVKWFKGYEMALAMGINVGFGRLGSFMAVAFTVDIAAGSMSQAVVFAAVLVALGFLMFLSYLIFDVRLDRQRKTDTIEPEDPFRFADLVALATNRSFVMIALLCVAFYSAVFPFMQYAPDLLVNKFGFTSVLPALPPGSSWLDHIRGWLTNGPKIASLIPLGTILFTPLFGALVDRKGKAATLMILGGVLLIFAHISLSVLDNVWLGYAGLLCLGVAFSLVPAAMWPSVAKIVPERRLGTAYAAMFTVQNWGLAFFFWSIGKVLDLANAGNQAAIDAKEMPYDYTLPILMLVGLGAVSIMLAFGLKTADRKQGFGLEDPSSAGKAG
jgi:MFS family permease